MTINIQNDSGNVRLKLNQREFQGIVNIESLSCNDNVETTQFIASNITISERGNRDPYLFSIELTILGEDNIEGNIRSINAIRDLKEPVDIAVLFYRSPIDIINKLEKYGITKINILDIQVNEYQTHCIVLLNCEEYIEYDILNIQYTDLQQFQLENVSNNDFVDLSEWLI